MLLKDSLETFSNVGLDTVNQGNWSLTIRSKLLCFFIVA